MLDFLEELRHRHATVQLFAFDRPGPERDRNMAAVVTRHIAAESVLIVLTGNVHSRIRNGTPWDPNFETMGAFIKAQHNETISVQFGMQEGTAWVCAPECGVRDIASQAKPLKSGFTRSDGKNNHDWNWWLDVVTASPPARGVID